FPARCRRKLRGLACGAVTRNPVDSCEFVSRCPAAAVSRQRLPTLANRETHMKVRDAMTRDVRLTRPAQTIREATHLMAELDIGPLPVEDKDKLVGMITDRDIAVRAVAEGLGPDTPINKVMSTQIKYCYDDQDIDEITRNMADIRVRRLPVVDRNKRLVGIL